MKTFRSFIFSLVLLGVAPAIVSANPPLKVIYSNTQTTHFKWTWPYQTVRTTTYVQTKPYFYSGQLLNISREDLRKYRFHYRQYTYKRPWGYYFPKGTKLGSKAILSFGAVQPNDKVSSVIVQK